MSDAVFQRVETKYLLSRRQYDQLLAVMQDRMILDQYGKQTVNNVYFDNDNYELIANSIEKPVYKEKVRMRVYGKPGEDSLCFFELKKKYLEVVYKRRISCPLKKVEDYIKSLEAIEDSQIFREIDYVYRSKVLRPKVYIAYDRAAYYGADDPSFRMTFDTGIRYRHVDPDIKKQDDVEYLLGPEHVLMEIKCQMVYPRWLIDFLNANGIFKTSYSKYGNIYKRLLQMNKEKISCIA